MQSTINHTLTNDKKLKEYTSTLHQPDFLKTAKDGSKHSNHETIMTTKYPKSVNDKVDK